VVGEFAVHLALAQGRKCFYTTPLKALSNQKYGDLVRRYSAAQVGLLTGDNSVNGGAPVVVMTTEVLRNMLYLGSPTLAGLGHVVLDEVHYLADRSRGGVWEEVIIHLAESVALTALSATVSNAEEFGDWLTSVRGDTTVIVDEHRPVPLWQHMLVGGRLYDLFGAHDKNSARRGSPRVNPDLIGALPPDRARFARPRRADVITMLDRAALLPAITFIFSRAGCDAAVQQCLAAGLRLTTNREAGQIEAIVAERVAGIDAADLATLGFDGWLAGLRRGIAAHHAGLLPAFKEAVEYLFAAGLVRAVFATETLALGINMPARTVVIERLDKWDGQGHTALTAGEYTQLTGRAGRRGIDVEGHAVVVWQRGVDPADVAGLAGTRTYPLNSSFRPSYNMAVNLVGQVGRQRASRLLESSFAQFQADRAVVGLARRARTLRESAVSLADSCDRGDFAEYARIRAELSELERAQAKSRAATLRIAVAESLRQARRGDVIVVPGGRRGGTGVVLQEAPDGQQDPALTILTERRQVKRLAASECPGPVTVIEQIRIPARFNPRSPQHRKDLAATMRNKLAESVARPRASARRAPPAPALDPRAISDLRRRLCDHPCHHCPDREEHARKAEQYLRAEREADALDRKIAGRAHVIARTFDRVCAVLAELGYLSGDQVTPDGRLLGRLYCELDLLAAECVRRGTWDGLPAAGLAACVSALTFESRGPSEQGSPGARAATAIPDAAARQALATMIGLAGELEAIERGHGLAFQREPDQRFAHAAQAWAAGQPLDRVLSEDMTPGDFVRAVKQLIDLLDQIRLAAATARPDLSDVAAAAVRELRRGIIAHDPVR
jgi:ATP-dependent RNA helicase HelY